MNEDILKFEGMIRLIKHEAVPKRGSFEVRFSDGRPSHFFYWDDIAGDASVVTFHVAVGAFYQTRREPAPLPL
jgi:hypothetical protein